MKIDIRKVFLLSIFILQIVMISDVLKFGIWPIKEALLVGENLVGRLSRKIDPSIPVLSPYGYDSQFFWAISLDPFMSNQQVIQSLDSPSYRYQRIFFPFIVWLVSAGNILLVPYNLFFLNVLGWIAGIFAVKKIAGYPYVKTDIAILSFILNAGILFSLFHPLADLWATSLVLVSFLMWNRNQHLLAGCFFALAGLTKETTVLVPASIFLFNLIEDKRFITRKNLILVCSVIPILLWEVYIKHRLVIWSFQQSVRNFDFPYVAIGKLLYSSITNHRGIPTAFVPLGMGILYFLVILRIKRPANLLEMIVFVQAIFLSFAGSAILEDIGSLSRASILFSFFLVLWCLNSSCQGISTYKES